MNEYERRRLKEWAVSVLITVTIVGGLELLAALVRK